VGTTVFGGMIAATTLNLVFIPVLYVIVRSLVPERAAQAVPHTDCALFRGPNCAQTSVFQQK